LFKGSALAGLGCVALLACREPSPHALERAKRTPPPANAPAPSVPPTPTAVAAASSATVTDTAAISPAAPSKAPSEAERPSLCNEQTPQSFLVSAHFDSFNASGGTAREWQQLLGRAVRYRTEQYGYVKGFGDPAWSASTPIEQARLVTFFGVPVSIHRRIAPALSCVETAIRAQCTSEPYQPYVLSGLRKRNTYLNGEISNHVYGIALDVDPTRNPCCGCVGEWRTSDRCQNDKTKFQRMDMPRCWITQFERFGFYWLGHAKIEDTMHFEFLADPGRIVRR